jgi:hypothetical protein
VAGGSIKEEEETLNGQTQNKLPRRITNSHLILLEQITHNALYIAHT